MERLFAERGGRQALDIVSQLRIEDYSTAQVQLAKVTTTSRTARRGQHGGQRTQEFGRDVRDILSPRRPLAQLSCHRHSRSA